MFKTPPLKKYVHAVNILIFSLVRQSRVLLALGFLSLSVWLVSRYVFSIGQSLFTGGLRIVFVFAILTVAPLISEYQLGNTPVTLAVLQKRLGTFLVNYHKLAQYH